jgi:trans-aconitate 2-methyltransferase
LIHRVLPTLPLRPNNRTFGKRCHDVHKYKYDTSVSDAWNPQQYERFKVERSQPFWDLVDLVEPAPVGGRVVDLGCGTGELTAALVERWQPAELIGIDSSPAMLAEATPRAGGVLRFERGDLADPSVEGRFDVIVSNAALHWVDDHRAVLARWRDRLGPAGQLAVQVPANLDHPAHRLADEVAHEAPFFDALAGDVPPDTVHTVLRPEEYAELLDQLDFARQHVRLQVYGHHLPDTAAVAEWVKGSSLTRFRERMDEATWSAFVERYRQRLLEVLGTRSPYFYAFKRILLWGRLA